MHNCDHPTGYIWPKEIESCPYCLTNRTGGEGFICNCPVCPSDCNFRYNKTQDKKESMDMDFIAWSEMQKERIKQTNETQNISFH